MKVGDGVGFGLALITSILVASPAHAQLGRLKKAIGASVDEQTGPKAVDANGLRNIMPQWDPRKDTSEQFPHVAVTVLKTPSMWAMPAHADLGGGREGDLVAGCFTLQLRIWSDAVTSKVVGPFDWCSLRDSELRPGIRSSSTALAGTINSRLLTSTDQKYFTGLVRTEGPRPPDTLAPEDPQTLAFATKNHSRASITNLSGDTSSQFGHMFFNLRRGMGQVLDTSSDHRVWIVQIIDPARPPAVAPGTLSEPIPGEPLPGGAGQSGTTPSAGGVPAGYTESNLPCDPKTFKSSIGVCTANRKVAVPTPPTLVRPGTVAGAPLTFAEGDVVVAKIANVKLMADPSDGARVAGTVGPADALVVIGAEQNGFLKVQGATSAGWVRRALVGKK